MLFISNTVYTHIKEDVCVYAYKTFPSVYICIQIHRHTQKQMDLSEYNMQISVHKWFWVRSYINLRTGAFECVHMQACLLCVHKCG